MCYSQFEFSTGVNGQSRLSIDENQFTSRGRYLAAHIHEAPVWVVPCLEDGTPMMARLYASIR